MRVYSLAYTSGHDGGQHSPPPKPEHPLYLPSTLDAADLRICFNEFLVQISGFPQFLKTRPLFLTQVWVDRVQPIVEVAYDPAHS